MAADDGIGNLASQISRFQVLFNNLNNNVPLDARDRKNSLEYESKAAALGLIKEFNFSGKFLSQAERALSHREKRLRKASPQKAVTNKARAVPGKAGAVFVLKSQRCPVVPRAGSQPDGQELTDALGALLEAKHLGSHGTDQGSQTSPLSPVTEPLATGGPGGGPVSRLPLPSNQQADPGAQAESWQSPTPTLHTPGRPTLQANFPNNMPTVEYKSQNLTGKRSDRGSNEHPQPTELSDAASALNIASQSLKGPAAPQDRDHGFEAASFQARTHTRLQTTDHLASGHQPTQADEFPKQRSQVEVRPSGPNPRHQFQGQRTEGHHREATDDECASAGQQRGASASRPRNNAEPAGGLGLRVEAVAKNRYLVVTDGRADLAGETGPATLGSGDGEREDTKSAARKVLYSNRAGQRAAPQGTETPSSPVADTAGHSPSARPRPPQSQEWPHGAK